jgi:hypothetical protein
MVNVKVYFKVAKMGPCGQVKNYAEYAVHKGDINLLKDDCIELMEDFENGVDDAYRIIFQEDSKPILEVVNKDGEWHRYQHEELIIKSKDYHNIFM